MQNNEDNPGYTPKPLERPKLKIPQPLSDGERLRYKKPPTPSPLLSIDGKTVLPNIRQPGRGTPFG
jgi:hypothetical protein